MLASLVALLLGMSGSDSTLPLPITQLVHTTWTVTDGAPADIYQIAQTPDGYLWLGTQSGVVRFDGVRFVPLAVLGADIPNGGVLQLLTARDSSLWIVWWSGMVSQWRNGRLRTYGERDGLLAAMRLTESRNGTLVA